MIKESKQSLIFDIVSKTIVESVCKYIPVNKNYIESKAKQFYQCSQQQKEVLTNSIFNKCEHDINLTSTDELVKILYSLEKHSPHVCNITEFKRLFNSLYRFTHSQSFFTTCLPTITATLSTLITMIITNKLIYAADMIEQIETYLFDNQKSMSQDLNDLLSFKYGLINIAQYKIFPKILGTEESTDLIAGSNNTLDVETHVSNIINMPVKSSIVSEMYNFLLKRGISPYNNEAEFTAGLKIEELDTIKQMSSPDATMKIVPLNNQEKVTMAVSNLLKTAHDKSKGYIQDGAVSSPITNNKSIGSFIPFSDIDLHKFAILEYLYIMRVMASCIKKKQTIDKGNSTTLNINAPFKVCVPTGSLNLKHLP
ncbi:Virion structural phosphoprotein, early morphogenesis [Eptesipox virus]|uniref:Assembly protein G7 n=1 Tax=Eptesipox virus TaxID=1329402 RepID=A0A220T6D1_9POXV|nr:Virion structural phosphoprotein, early morphogenesis [Eptesipox virus]ASK51262.1 Virion structural phosphoprotein, early morphogenesis [Eptesipox virus]WAH71020.1 virion structural phosphoprotein, early morphogenesis [Eptesipox virus]